MRSATAPRLLSHVSECPNSGLDLQEQVGQSTTRLSHLSEGVTESPKGWGAAQATVRLPHAPQAPVIRNLRTSPTPLQPVFPSL